MSTSIERQKLSIEQMVERFARLAEVLSTYEDDIQAKKMLQLIEKVENKQAVIGFCGHFSAGKSTMLNTLLEKDVLPSSPIPTSANLVRVKKGEDYARIYYTNDKTVQFAPPFDMKAVQELCKDGENVHSLEISDQDVAIPSNVVVMDTPGIDSTDDAHRLATESSLHLSDVIFYVMDYNHVQSEVNFTFTKTLQDIGKDIYLVVNQIDKHDERELSFSSFQNSTAASFANWGVEPKGIYYTTLFDPENAHNQFSQVQKLLTQESELSEEVISTRALSAAQQIIEDHLKHVEDAQEERRQELQQLLLDEDVSTLKSKVVQIQEELAVLKREGETFEKTFRDELDDLLDNAYLMPATTRDLAHLYLESREPNFKVGLLFAKKKTEEERQQRLQNFYNDFREKVDKELSFHIKGFLEKILKTFNLDDEELHGQIHSIQVDFDESLLKNTVKSGAAVSGDYVLNYTNDVAAEVKRLYRHALMPLMEQAKASIQKHNQQRIDELNNEYKQYEAKMNAANELVEIDKALSQRRAELEVIAAQEASIEEKHKALEWLASAREVVSEAEAPLRSKQEKARKVKEPQIEEASDAGTSIEEVEKTIDALMKSATAVQNVKGMTSYANTLRNKAEKLEKRSFTFALFGAFSAGKSSFANALMGDAILPVSPNPTTAAINKIAPPDAEHPDGTVVIKFKNTEQLLEDLNAALHPFNMEQATVEQALEAVDSVQKNSAEDNVHLAFLQAAKRGYHAVKDSLGEMVTVSQAEFAGYAAEEEKSCFVEWMTLYKDCPLTEKGITLVDTPGADSINARHTNTAFHYIKNADAILFVTYYNHAFSKADREFLIQLGRVKETFELDKMFFIVNASDLAKTEDELDDVVTYVGDELTGYGIRLPKIFPLSSKYALESKLGKENDHGAAFGEFEGALESFIQHELTDVAVQAAKTDLTQTKDRLQSLLEMASQSADEKAKRKEQALTEQQLSNEKMNNVSLHSYTQSVLQEVEELVYYVEQRMFLRFTDFYNEAFHPGAFRNGNPKDVLQRCMQELIDSLGFDLSQEMRATTLRIENVLNKKLQSYDEKLQREAKEQNDELNFLSFERIEFEEQDFENGLKQEEANRYRDVLNQFKNAKQFFEQGGKREIREILKDRLQSPVHAELEQYAEQFKVYYEQLFLSLTEEQLQKRVGDVNEFYDGLLEALSETVDTTVLERAYDVLVEAER
ncbi:dynamin family protein [Bacillus tianshenii]|nr:dynamin family protein [Bacillus tianshenii]